MLQNVFREIHSGVFWWERGVEKGKSEGVTSLILRDKRTRCLAINLLSAQLGETYRIWIPSCWLLASWSITRHSSVPSTNNGPNWHHLNSVSISEVNGLLSCVESRSFWK